MKHAAAPTYDPPSNLLPVASGAELSNIPYARSQMMETLRRKDDRRAKKRQERLERKAAERQAKEEQLKRLKNIKRQELQNKLQQIKLVLGQQQQPRETDPTLDEDAIMKLLEGDYDPEQYQQLMENMYNDEYYQGEETEWKTDTDVRNAFVQQSVLDEEKEVVGPDDMDGGLYDNIMEYDDEQHVDENQEEWYGDEEEEQQFDDDYEDQAAETEIERKVKAKMEEELYKLDYEDIVAGMPTRFKYRSVPKNNYGLSTMEILCARDTTLKQYVSLKKLAPYNEDEYVVHSTKRRKFRSLIQKEIMEEEPTIDETAVVAGSEPVSKGKTGSTATGSRRAIVDTNDVDDTENPTTTKKRRRRLKKKNGVIPSDTNDAPDDEPQEMESNDATTINHPAAAKDILDHSVKGDGEEAIMDVQSDGNVGKKRRRRKKKKSGAEPVDDTEESPDVIISNASEAKKVKNDTLLGSVETVSKIKKEAKGTKKKETKMDKLRSTKVEPQQKKKKTSAAAITGLPNSRLAAYGL